MWVQIPSHPSVREPVEATEAVTLGGQVQLLSIGLGDIAQSGEHCAEDTAVVGSSPTVST